MRLAASRAVAIESPDKPLDFEQTIEATLKDLHQRFLVHGWMVRVKLAAD
jgi:hypothetical protein